MRDIPVVMLTAKNLEEDKYWGRELGADEYVTKPYDPEELERTVERIFSMGERGEGYHPLTKLPEWHAVQTRRPGAPRAASRIVAVSCTLEPEAFETYRMKCGNIKADTVVQQLGQMIAAGIRKEAGAVAFLGHGGDNVFYLIFPPGGERSVVRSVDAQFAAAVRYYYQEEDVARGCVVVPGTPAGRCIPLLRISWRELDPPALL